MANFTVNSANSLYQGTVDADVFLINTALGVTVNGSAGNDTITAGAAAGTYQSGSLNGDSGDDLFNLNARTGTFSAFSVIGGAGADTVALNDARAVNFVIRGGDDVDRFTLASSVFTDSTVGGGAADDLITAVNASFQGSRLQAGAGNDNIVATASITAFLSSTVELGGGDDTFAFSGVASQATIGGSEGLDTITLAAAGLQANSNNSIGGGAGADQIFINGTIGTNIAANFGTVQGGGGNDIIRVSGVAATTGGIIFGGAGADSIDLTNIQTGAVAINPGAVNAASGMIVAYSAFSDSTLGSNQGVGTMDVISATTISGSGVSTFMMQQSAVTFQNIVSGAYADGAVWNGSGQYIFGNNAAALATLQSRVSTIDSQLTTNGQAAAFQDINGNNYVFVQGGTTDLLVNISQNVSGVAVALSTNNQLKVFITD